MAFRSWSQCKTFHRSKLIFVVKDRHDNFMQQALGVAADDVPHDLLDFGQLPSFVEGPPALELGGHRIENRLSYDRSGLVDELVPFLQFLYSCQ